MTTPVNDGGPAFPNKDEFGSMIPGMSLRDWFAGQALIGLMCNPEAFANMANKDVAENCWSAADAMIAAREAK